MRMMLCMQHAVGGREAAGTIVTAVQCRRSRPLAPSPGRSGQPLGGEDAWSYRCAVERRWRTLPVRTAPTEGAHMTTIVSSGARVTSRDGTEIGYYTSGQGPPLLLVHGALGDHTRWDALRPHLEPHLTVDAMDRRGRGASGGPLGLRRPREFEDAAVVDAVTETSGARVAVAGSSAGASFALVATALTANTTGSCSSSHSPAWYSRPCPQVSRTSSTPCWPRVTGRGCSRRPTGCSSG